MEYNFSAIEQKWQQHWKDSDAYKVSNNSPKPKYYVLDMFPYPSGAGLHVGHPLGYIASDIYARFKRLKGYNVLHPMGYDSFGLPAEQYALETGQHPATTTEKNIATFRSQLDKIGFCFDWSREVRTSDPQYYKWTQWLFLQLYNSYFCNTEQKALPIEKLIHKYATQGAMPKTGAPIPGTHFTAEEWNGYTQAQQEAVLAKRRLAFCAYGEVNWCEALGTVLANDEVINGVSERGGHPVVKKKMRQWYLRITAYADRLLEGLEKVEFSEAMKEMQRNWIGKSQGAEIDFSIDGGEALKLKVYTTRPDTIFGVDFMVLAPEHELVAQITSPEQKEAIDNYLTYVKSRSDRERQAEVKVVTGCFTGAYALNPFDGRKIPIWIAEYVLAGYGTGAIMAVPCGDQRDYTFAQHFSIPITNIIGDHYNGQEANPTKEAVLENSGFLNGLLMKDAIGVAIDKLEAMGIGKRKVNYRMRDAGFSRQRYWGEPFPIIWKDGTAYPLDESELPLELPHVDSYGPGPEGEGPLANIPSFVETPRGLRETSTMPGYAGSSWYFLRYMDPHNDQSFCDRSASDYWNQVDLYIGGTEHAVGHLLYSRMWTKVLYDLGLIGFDEPFRRLLNQGMIQGKSYFCDAISGIHENGDRGAFLCSRNSAKNYFPDITFNNEVYKVEREQGQPYTLKEGFKFVDSFDRLTESKFIELLRNQRAHEEHIKDLLSRVFWEKDLTESGERFIKTEMVVEKMSKSKYNVENPDILCEQYGADTFRMYEMFLGPVEMSKPWDTKGIEGVHRFLRKLWRLFFDDIKGKVWNEDTANPAELKVLHKTIKKIEGDTENFSFNTAVSAFMVCVNELTDLKCHKKEVLSPLLILLTPYAPHISEELWSALGYSGSVLDADFPQYNEQYLVESEKEYPISINGKMRTTINIATSAEQPEVEQIVLANEVVQKWLEGNPPKKIVFVKGRMVNVVV
jgi:leucyl-tRNA synthetase